MSRGRDGSSSFLVLEKFEGVFESIISELFILGASIGSFFLHRCR